MKKVLLIDDKWYFRAVWMWRARNKFTFLHANTTDKARELFRDHPDIAAIIVDAHMDKGFGIKRKIPVREWGFDTHNLIMDLRLQFKGPIIASPCQPWHFKPMMNAGCTHYAWKWRVARLLKKLLL
ncbi:MAG TPA: hypothetical protein VJI96_00785 [Candidatus Andersenbacteria bacterium]|nr:hypothetical protein [Candidatus Andersenbacteria bacterium]